MAMRRKWGRSSWWGEIDDDADLELARCPFRNYEIQSWDDMLQVLRLEVSMILKAKSEVVVIFKFLFCLGRGRHG